MFDSHIVLVTMLVLTAISCYLLWVFYFYILYIFFKLSFKTKIFFFCLLAETYTKIFGVLVMDSIATTWIYIMKCYIHKCFILLIKTFKSITCGKVFDNCLWTFLDSHCKEQKMVLFYHFSTFKMVSFIYCAAYNFW